MLEIAIPPGPTSFDFFQVNGTPCKLDEASSWISMNEIVPKRYAAPREDLAILGKGSRAGVPKRLQEPQLKSSSHSCSINISNLGVTSFGSLEMVKFPARLEATTC